MAKMYQNGEGVVQSYAGAAKWYRKAAEQGFADAQSNLGLMYLKGEGVVQDYVLAHMWLNLARAQENEDAKKALEELLVNDTMTKEQIAEAQKMAREWQEQHAESSD
ncbi:MAG: tetratricopeptide repeat protein [Myxococcota bacterium]|nr:tetratricopeptide repeat protein [Myxococcota bacterium]